MSQCANVKARFYYHINQFAMFLIMLSGAAIGFLSIFGDGYKYATAAMGFGVTAIKVALGVYSPEKRCVQLKTISQRLSKMSRDVKRLLIVTVPIQQLNDRLDQYYDEYDSLDLSLYDIGNESKINHIIGKALPSQGTDLP